MPGRTGAPQQLEGAPDEQAGGAHAGELLGRLALAAVTVEQTHAAKPYRRPADDPHIRDPAGSHAGLRVHAAIAACTPKFCVPVVHRPGTGSGSAGSRTARWPDGRATRGAGAAAQDGVVSSTDAARVGVGAVQLDGLVRSGRLVRVRRGAYVLRAAYEAADPRERYRLRTKAILRTRPRSTRRATTRPCCWPASTPTASPWTSSTSSAVRAPRVRTGLRTHPASASTSRWSTAGARVLPPIALCQVAGGSGVGGRRLLDGRRAARGSVHADQLREAVDLLPEHHRGAAERAIALTDPACESVGETRTRLLLRDLGFAVPVAGASCAVSVLRRSRRLPGRRTRGRRVRRAREVRGPRGRGRAGRGEGARVGDRRPGYRWSGWSGPTWPTRPRWRVASARRAPEPSCVVGATGA